MLLPLLALLVPLLLWVLLVQVLSSPRALSLLRIRTAPPSAISPAGASQ